MPEFKAKLGSLLRPSASEKPALHGRSDSDHESHSFFGPCRSKMAASCEVFSMFKALAAGTDPEGIAAEVDSDDDETVPPNSAPVNAKPPPSPRTQKQEKDQILEDWVQDTTTQNDALGSKFAGTCACTTVLTGIAMSMSNLSSFTAKSASDAKNKKRPALPTRPSHDLDSPELRRTSEDSATETAISSGMTTPTESTISTPGFHVADEVDDATKLAAIIEEYGDVASLFRPGNGSSDSEPERMLAECKGSLFK